MHSYLSIKGGAVLEPGTLMSYLEPPAVVLGGILAAIMIFEALKRALRNEEPRWKSALTVISWAAATVMAVLYRWPGWFSGS